MPHTTHAIETGQKSGAHGAGTLEPSIEAAKELARALSAIPEDSLISRHPNCAVARAMTLTVIDMLEEMAKDAERRAHGHGGHHHHRHDHGHSKR